MLGFEDQWVLDFEKELQPPKQPRSEFDTVYEVGRISSFLNSYNPK